MSKKFQKSAGFYTTSFTLATSNYCFLVMPHVCNSLRNVGEVHPFYSNTQNRCCILFTQPNNNKIGRICSRDLCQAGPSKTPNYSISRRSSMSVIDNKAFDHFPVCTVFKSEESLASLTDVQEIERMVHINDELKKRNEEIDKFGDEDTDDEEEEEYMTGTYYDYHEEIAKNMLEAEQKRNKR